ncbi:MAG TPA: polyhydroxyalkanoate granule-associated phasin [Usitatibacteraceae bacterium]|nr:polyhydroxyalkanoate granule-associated phasin [Usitatibacteraceae bacterium]
MTRRVPRYSYLAPFMQWSDLAMKTGEMMLASAQVIGHRTGRMARAGASPSAGDWREFALMGQEKLDAGAQSGQAMASHMMTMNPQLGAQAFADMVRSTSALMSLVSSQTPAQMFARQAELARVLERSAESLADASASAVRLAHHALTPIHASATANAKRLARR